MLPSYTDPKVNFAQKVRQIATQLAQAAEGCVMLDEVYNHRLYGPGAEHAITDAELVNTGLTADQLYAFVILCNQLSQFMNGQAPSVNDYKSTLDSVRQDL